MKRFTFGLTAPIALATTLMAAPFAYSQEPVEVHLYHTTSDGPGDPVGTVTLESNEHGVLLTPELSNLEPGLHGFHIHKTPDCGPAKKDGKKTAAAAAGGHYDPENTGKHRGPYSSEGHLGDLPVLYVDESGNATVPVLAPKLKLADLEGRALMVHAGGDNYSDKPKALGGGGARVACGVVGGS